MTDTITVSGYRYVRLIDWQWPEAEKTTYENKVWFESGWYVKDKPAERMYTEAEMWAVFKAGCFTNFNGSDHEKLMKELFNIYINSINHD